MVGKKANMWNITGFENILNLYFVIIKTASRILDCPLPVGEHTIVFTFAYVEGLKLLWPIVSINILAAVAKR